MNDHLQEFIDNYLDNSPDPEAETEDLIHELIMRRGGNHLAHEVSDRGFNRLPPIESTYGGQVRAYESSAASAPHVWLNVTCPSNLNAPDGDQSEAIAHLTVEDATKLADQLHWLVANHYQRRNP